MQSASGSKFVIVQRRLRLLLFNPAYYPLNLISLTLKFYPNNIRPILFGFQVFGFNNVEPVCFVGPYLVPQFVKLLKTPAKLKN
jgi:hypothetical protein